MEPRGRVTPTSRLPPGLPRARSPHVGRVAMDVRNASGELCGRGSSCERLGAPDGAPARASLRARTILIVAAAGLLLGAGLGRVRDVLAARREMSVDLPASARIDPLSHERPQGR